MYNCIICKNQTINLKIPNLKSVIPMGDKLSKFILLQCGYCGHIQKKIDVVWKKSIKNLYSQKYFFLGKHISIEKKKVINRNDQSVNLISKSLKLKRLGNFLDIGCGAGQFIESFLKIKKNWNVYAHDLTELNKKKVSKYKIKKFFVGDIKKIDKKFDLISMNHVLEHLTTPTQTLKDVKRLLKKDGKLVLRLPNIQYVHTDLTIQDHCSHFDYNSLLNLLRITGFTIVKSLNKINPIELFLIVKKTDKTLKIKKKKIDNKKLHNLLWPSRVCSHIKNNRSKKIGIFGVGTASFYYFAALKKKISFFVDEDPLKIDKQYYNRKIHNIKKIPDGSDVYIGIHNQEFANKIKKRISKINKKVNFIVP